MVIQEHHSFLKDMYLSRPKNGILQALARSLFDNFQTKIKQDDLQDHAGLSKTIFNQD